MQSRTIAIAWMRAFPATSGIRPLRTNSERAIRARADDRNRGRSERKPAAAVERFLIVLSVAERIPPVGPSGRARPARGRRAADAARHAMPRHATPWGLPRISAPAGGAMVVLNQQPAPRRARRDDLIGLPTTWVIARIDARAR